MGECCKRCGVELRDGSEDFGEALEASSAPGWTHVHTDARCADRLAARLKIATGALRTIEAAAHAPPGGCGLYATTGVARAALAALDAATKGGET